MPIDDSLHTRLYLYFDAFAGLLSVVDDIAVANIRFPEVCQVDEWHAHYHDTKYIKFAREGEKGTWGELDVFDLSYRRFVDGPFLCRECSCADLLKEACPVLAASVEDGTEGAQVTGGGIIFESPFEQPSLVTDYELGRNVVHGEAFACKLDERPDSGEFILQRAGACQSATLLNLVHHCRQKGPSVFTCFISITLHPSDIDRGSDMAYF